MVKIILWLVGLILLAIIISLPFAKAGSKGSRAEEKRYGVKSMEALPEYYIEKFNKKNGTENN